MHTTNQGWYFILFFYLKRLLCAPRLDLFDQKYSENSNIAKIITI